MSNQPEVQTPSLGCFFSTVSRLFSFFCHIQVIGGSCILEVLWAVLDHLPSISAAASCLLRCIDLFSFAAEGTPAAGTSGQFSCCPWNRWSLLTPAPLRGFLSTLAFNNTVDPVNPRASPWLKPSPQSFAAYHLTPYRGDSWQALRS